MWRKSRGIRGFCHCKCSWVDGYNILWCVRIIGDGISKEVSWEDGSGVQRIECRYWNYNGRAIGIDDGCIVTKGLGNGL